MEEQDKYREDSFVARWVAGELSATEIEQFEEWVQANPDEKQYFDDLKNLWSDVRNVHLQKGLSKEERWAQISDRLYLTPEAFTKTGRSGGAALKWGGLAIAVAAVVGFFYLWTVSAVQTFVSPRGSRIALDLPDGSKVNLNAESTLEFAERDWDRRRELTLTGEAFFEVVNADAPFVVKTKQATTGVLGTSFNVKARGSAVEVACISGSVSVRSNYATAAPVTLSPGLASTVIENRAPSQPYAFEIEEKTGWTEGTLHFRSTPLPVVFHEIARQFDVTITLEKPIQDADFTGRVELTDAGRALEFVCLTSGLNFRSTDADTFVIY